MGAERKACGKENVGEREARSPGRPRFLNHWASGAAASRTHQGPTCPCSRERGSLANRFIVGIHRTRWRAEEKRPGLGRSSIPGKQRKNRHGQDSNTCCSSHGATPLLRYAHRFACSCSSSVRRDTGNTLPAVLAF